MFYRWKLQIKQLLLNSLNQIEAKNLFILLSKYFEKIIPFYFNIHDWFEIWSSCFLKTYSSSKPVFWFLSRFHCGCTHRIIVVMYTWSHFVKENFQQFYRCFKYVYPKYLCCLELYERCISNLKKCQNVPVLYGHEIHLQCFLRGSASARNIHAASFWSSAILEHLTHWQNQCLFFWHKFLLLEWLCSL